MQIRKASGEEMLALWGVSEARHRFPAARKQILLAAM